MLIRRSEPSRHARTTISGAGTSTSASGGARGSLVISHVREGRCLVHTCAFPLVRLPTVTHKHSESQNPNLNATIVYGGYNPRLASCFPSIDQYFSFSYFADTFVLEHNSPKPRWRHVLTRGFPTYRAMGALRTDPDTGRMYLFGGYTNTSLVPDTKHINARSFGDL